MKKIVLISVVSMLFYSCQVSFKTFVKYLPEVTKELSYVSKEHRMNKKSETTYHYGRKSSFVLTDEGVFIPCKVNDTTCLLFYDTENNNHAFLEQISGNAEFPKTFKTVKVRTIIPNVTMKRGLDYYNIESDFFDFKQSVGRLFALSNDTVTPICLPENTNNRFSLSVNVFPKWGDIMLLNFSDTSITLLDSNSLYDTIGFTPIKAAYTCRGFFIWSTVDSIEYQFVFNTTSKEFLSIPQHQYAQHKKEDDIFIAKYRKTEYADMILDTAICQQTNTITMEDGNAIMGDVLYVKYLSKPVMGMAFISQFDWIIDPKGKVYAKKIKDKQDKDYHINPYLVNVFDTVLRITSLPVGNIEYPLFAIVDSINGEKVSTNNICQMKDLLNKRNGFKDNKILILHSANTMFLKN